MHPFTFRSEQRRLARDPAGMPIDEYLRFEAGDIGAIGYLPRALPPRRTLVRQLVPRAHKRRPRHGSDRGLSASRAGARLPRLSSAPADAGKPEWRRGSEPLPDPEARCVRMPRAPRALRLPRGCRGHRRPCRRRLLREPRTRDVRRRPSRQRAGPARRCSGLRRGASCARDAAASGPWSPWCWACSGSWPRPRAGTTRSQVGAQR